jgi:protein-tyrosine phosphatase
MIDWHCHILPNLDDGASSLDESLAMARILAAAGYTDICCTPHHLRGMYETSPESMRQGIAELQGQFSQNGIQLTLYEGMEYCLDEFFVDDFFREPVTLAGTNRVLVETPANAESLLLRENVFALTRKGYVPLFAHPERHAFLAPPPRKSESFSSRLWLKSKNNDSVNDENLAETLLEELRQMGCEFQGNLGSVSGYYGSLVQKQEQRLRKAGLYKCYGSDGHTAESLERFLVPALESVRAAGSELLDSDIDLIAP